MTNDQKTKDDTTKSTHSLGFYSLLCLLCSSELAQTEKQYRCSIHWMHTSQTPQYTLHYTDCIYTAFQSGSPLSVKSFGGSITMCSVASVHTGLHCSVHWFVLVHTLEYTGTIHWSNSVLPCWASATALGLVSRVFKHYTLETAVYTRSALQSLGVNQEVAV